LRHLECDTNQITNLNVINSENLKHLLCWDNKLSNLDVSNTHSLTWFTCSTNKELSCIKVNQEQLSNIPSGWIKDQEAIYSLDCD